MGLTRLWVLIIAVLCHLSGGMARGWKQKLVTNI